MAARICYNGELTTPDTAGIRPEALTSMPALYQIIHTTAHRALHPEMHLEIVRQAFAAVYPDRPCPAPDTETLQACIGELLSENRCPRLGNSLRLLLCPQGLDGEPSPCWMLDAAAPLYYSGYTLWHKRLTLSIFPCEYLYMGYPTTVSQQIAGYGLSVAERAGCEAAVVENFDGVLTTVGDEPLFVVFGREVLTSPLACGATDSVMRRLIFGACRKEDVPMREEPLTRAMLGHCDEAFTASVQGLVSIDGYAGKRYFNLMAGRLIGSIR